MTAAAAAAAAAVPKWVLLERYVFRRDNDSSFPDYTVAPIRASGTTSWGADFRIAFSLADPPSISRLYTQLPSFPGPDEEAPLEIVATHRHLALLDITTSKPSSQDLVQNLFIFKVDGKTSSLRALPPTERYYDFFHGPGRQLRSSSKAAPRLLDPKCLGLWCGDKGYEFVVAELTPRVLTQGRTRIKADAEICFLRSSADDQFGCHKWKTMTVPILPWKVTTGDDLWKLSGWQTDAVIPFRQWLCWIDYHQGILFWDVSAGQVASFVWFPEDSFSLTTNKTLCSGNGGVSVVDHGQGSVLKFVYVARHDGGPAYGALKPGTGFTITCHTLVFGSTMFWNLDYTVTSDDLRGQFPPGGLPMLPLVDIDRPQVAYFLLIEFVRVYEKLSVLSIDMDKKKVVSLDLYLDGNEPGNEPDNADFVLEKCLDDTPIPFLPCEFPRFCYLSRKRKDME